MDKTLKELIRISNTVGRDPSLVQGGGGNTSVKTDNAQNMYIKASGTALKDMTAAQGWRRMAVDRTRAIITDETVAALERIDGIGRTVWLAYRKAVSFSIPRPGRAPRCSCLQAEAE